MNDRRPSARVTRKSSPVRGEQNSAYKTRSNYQPIASNRRPLSAIFGVQRVACVALSITHNRTRNDTMKRKYLIGILGLIVGVAVSFAATRSYNNRNAKAAPSSAASGMRPAGAGGSTADQQQMMGDIAKTIETAKNEPKNFDAQIEAAKAYYQIGRQDETIEYLERAYAADAEKTAAQRGALGFIGQHHFEKKNYTEAETWLKRAIAVETETADKAEIHVALAKSFMQRQPAQADKAVTELQAALKLAPKDAHAIAHLIEAYALKKDAKGAEAALAQLKTVEPQNRRIAALETLIADVKAGKPITLPKE